MQWTVKQGDILNETADILICSANVYLDLSGGVGGEILRRYGPAMQKELRRYLLEKRIHHVDRGDIVMTPSCGTEFTSVLHAVSVDGLYDSSPDVIETLVRESLVKAASLGARQVALVALATGYGQLQMTTFGKSISTLATADFPPLQEVIICVKNADDVQDLLLSIPTAARSSDEKRG